jgi:Arc/MetJ-type ribon-helix-helix transcriptional regulator
MNGKRIKRILLHVPSNFLEEFDREISGVYASRNEAIRAGMTLVLKAEKRRQTQKRRTPENT